MYISSFSGLLGIQLDLTRSWIFEGSLIVFSVSSYQLPPKYLFLVVLNWMGDLKGMSSRQERALYYECNVRLYFSGLMWCGGILSVFVCTLFSDPQVM